MARGLGFRSAGLKSGGFAPPNQPELPSAPQRAPWHRPRVRPCITIPAAGKLRHTVAFPTSCNLPPAPHLCLPKVFFSPAVLRPANPCPSAQLLLPLGSWHTAAPTEAPGIPAAIPPSARAPRSPKKLLEEKQQAKHVQGNPSEAGTNLAPSPWMRFLDGHHSFPPLPPFIARTDSLAKSCVGFSKPSCLFPHLKKKKPALPSELIPTFATTTPGRSTSPARAPGGDGGAGAAPGARSTGGAWREPERK